MIERSAPRFVAIPEFRVKPEVRAAFLDAALDDAHHSVTDEAGSTSSTSCARSTPREHRAVCEVYHDDRAASEEHLRAPHLKRFQAAMKMLDVERKTVVRFAALGHP
jgi:quinol monooxygenase YgiN